MISILGYLRYENTPNNMVYTQRIVNLSSSWVSIFSFGTPDRQNMKVLVKSIIEFLRKKKHFAKISIFPLKYM